MASEEAPRSPPADVWTKNTKGFTSYANRVLADLPLSVRDQQYLAREFDGARERMTNLASTVGTAGSFVLVLVALLVSFANGVRDESDKQTAAEQNQMLLEARCSPTSDKEECLPLRAASEKSKAEASKTRADHLNSLNTTQALIGACVLLGFVLGLVGVVVNPVRGPDAVADEEGTVDDDVTVKGWTAAVGRLKRKRNCIIGALAVQAVAIALIVVLALQVASDA